MLKRLSEAERAGIIEGSVANVQDARAKKADPDLEFVEKLVEVKRLYRILTGHE